MRKTNLLLLVGIVVGVFLTQVTAIYALTDAEIVRHLDERFAKGEISEKVYLELKAKYSGGKTEQAGTKPVESTEISGNLVKNGGFEEGPLDGFPEGWKISMMGDAKFSEGGPSARYAKKCIWVAGKEEAHSGSQCLKIQNKDKPTVGGIKQYIPVEAGKTYLFRMWLKCEDIKGTADGEAIIYWVGFRDLAGKVVKGGFSVEERKMRGTKDWLQIARTCTAPDGAVEVYITIFAYAANGTAWVDDVSLVAK